MIALRRRAAFPLLVGVTVGLGAVVAACGPSTGVVTTASPSASVRASASPALTAVPGGPSASAGSGPVESPSTTQTEFGLIWDALPPSFPKLPGQEPTEIGAGPRSGSFVLNMTASDASKAMETALKVAGWTVAKGSPLEDGTVVLEGTGTPSTCKTELRFTPTSGTILMSVLYGASCPFS